MSAFASRSSSRRLVSSSLKARAYEEVRIFCTSRSIVAWTSGLGLSRFPWNTTPTSSLMPHCMTMLRARRVACWMSLLAPLVTASTPNMSSSATRPPMHTSSLASICLRDMDVWSPDGSCITIPSAWPRGMIVALWTGSAPAVLIATSACPPSWKAVMRAVSGLITADLRSDPMRILSLAYSKAACDTCDLPSTDAFRAAWLTMLKRSAPDMPGVPRARFLRSRSFAVGIFVV
mmetsp:Transcript_42240/g.97789  ORF Transcript_42240/g.97789 Transcript_42240/m.97789 type:complete len:233 (-) Transcript_42240:233-931(-)